MANPLSSKPHQWPIGFKQNLHRRTIYAPSTAEQEKRPHAHINVRLIASGRAAFPVRAVRTKKQLQWCRRLCTADPITPKLFVSFSKFLKFTKEGPSATGIRCLSRIHSLYMLMEPAYLTGVSIMNKRGKLEDKWASSRR